MRFGAILARAFPRRSKRNPRRPLPQLEQCESRTLLSVVAVPNVAVVAARANMAELNGGTANFVFTRTGPLAHPLTVGFNVGGTATPVTDFSGLLDSVTFQPGQSRVVVPVTVVGDTLAEGNETIVLTLNSGDDFVVRPARSAATLTLRDSAPTVAIVPVRNVLPTVGRSGLLRIMRTGPINEPLTVNYTVAGTAISGTDFSELPGTITIPAGRRFALIDVSPLTNSLVATRQTVNLSLLSDPAYNVSTRLSQQAAGITFARPIVLGPSRGTPASGPIGLGGTGSGGGLTIIGGTGTIGSGFGGTTIGGASGTIGSGFGGTTISSGFGPSIGGRFTGSTIGSGSTTTLTGSSFGVSTFSGLTLTPVTTTSVNTGGLFGGSPAPFAATLATTT